MVLCICLYVCLCCVVVLLHIHLFSFRWLQVCLNKLSSVQFPPGWATRLYCRLFSVGASGLGEGWWRKNSLILPYSPSLRTENNTVPIPQLTVSCVVFFHCIRNEMSFIVQQCRLSVGEVLLPSSSININQQAHSTGDTYQRLGLNCANFGTWQQVGTADKEEGEKFIYLIYLFIIPRNDKTEVLTNRL